MQKPVIPLNQIRDLRCRHCQKFISCGPVYVVPDSSILCGRCRMFAKDIFRNLSYEAVASMFTYPCAHWEKHCPVTLRWNESLEHEYSCKYQGCCNFWSHPGAWFKGKREIPESGDIRFSVPEHLLDNIKCVLCDCYLSCEPVYIQTNGKNICHRCVSANGSPPNTLRNLAYEKIAHILIYPCIYRNRGCPIRLRFGREIWHHESNCSYGQIYKKISDNSNNANGKKRGVIQTHSGHTYGTITPNSQLFAPPICEKNDVNKDIIKSLARKQERKIRRADDLGTEFHRMNSEEESNEYSLTRVSASGSSTPDSIYVNSGYISEDMPQLHSNQTSRSNSMIQPVYTNEYLASHFPVFPGIGAMQNSHLPSNDLLASHFPVFSGMTHLQRSNSALQKINSFTGQDRPSPRYSSMNGNKDLINELKIRQNLIQRTNSLKEKGDQQNKPYTNNLDKNFLIHDQMRRD